MVRVTVLGLAACTSPGPPPGTTSTADTSTALPHSAHQWSARYGDAALQGLDALDVDGAGEVVAMGRFAGQLQIGSDTLEPRVSGGAQEVYLARFGPDGTPVRAVALGATFGWDLTIDDEDAVVVSGQTSSDLDAGGATIPAWSGLFVAKFDAAGNHLFSQGWPGLIRSGDLYQNRITSDADRNMIVAGSFSEPGDFGEGLVEPASFDVYVLSLTPDGAASWSTPIGGVGRDLVGDVATDAAGNVVVIGTYDTAFTVAGTTLPEGPGASLFVVKLDPSGTPLWASGFEAEVEPRMSLAVAPDGDVVFVAEIARATDFGGGPVGVGGASDVVLVRLDAAGNHVSSGVVAGAGVENPLGEVALDEDGNAVVTGGFGGTWDAGDQEHTAVQTDQFLVAVDPAGTTLWSHRFGEEGLQWGRAVAVGHDGAIVTGATGSGQIDYGDGVLEGHDLDVFLHQRIP